MSKTRLLAMALLISLLLPLGIANAQEASDTVTEDDSVLYQPEDDAEYYYDYDYDFEFDEESLPIEDLYFTTGDDLAAEDAVAGLLGAGAMAMFTGVYLLVILVFGLGGYIFNGLALSKMGKEMGYANPWFAWVPILNSIMMLELGNQNPWLLLLILIPGIGGLAIMIITIIALMNITEKRGYEKLLALLILVPFGMFVLLYLLAWRPKTTTVA